ncbi:MAG TPA: hypothetical protein VFF78_06735, partial [Anaerolineaceae bacterium]|nr:hypothetical protein [Anaerolineaceae bacterium]
EELLGLLEKYEAEVANQLLIQQARMAKPGSSPRRSQREQYLWDRIAGNLRSSLQNELDWVRQVQQGIRTKEYLNRTP